MVEENTINRITMQYASSSLSTSDVETFPKSAFRYEDDKDGLFSQSDGSLGTDSVFQEKEPFNNFHSAIDFSFNGFDDNVSNMENSSGSDTFHSIRQYSSAFSASQKSMGGVGSFHRRRSSHVSLPVSVCEEASEEIEESEDLSNFEPSTTSVIIEMPLKGAAEWNESSIQKQSDISILVDPGNENNSNAVFEQYQYPHNNSKVWQLELDSSNTTVDVEVKIVPSHECARVDGKSDDSTEKGSRSISWSEGFLSRYKNDHNIELISATSTEQARIVSRNNLSHYESSATINFEDSRPTLHDSSCEFKMEYGVDSFKIRELESRMRHASRLPSVSGSSNDCMHFFYSDVDHDEGDSPTGTRQPDKKMVDCGTSNDSGDDLTFWITPQNGAKDCDSINDIHPKHSIDSFNRSRSGISALADTDRYRMNDSPTIENGETKISSVAAILEEDFKKAALFESVCETLDTDISSSDSKSICSQTPSNANGDDTITTHEQTDIDSLLSVIDRSQSDAHHISQNDTHERNPSYNRKFDTKMSGIVGVHEGTSDIGNTDIGERMQLILSEESSKPITTRNVDESLASPDDFQLRHASQSPTEKEKTTTYRTSMEDLKISLHLPNLLRQIDTLIHRPDTSAISFENKQMIYNLADIIFESTYIGTNMDMERGVPAMSTDQKVDSSLVCRIEDSVSRGESGVVNNNTHLYEAGAFHHLSTKSIAKRTDNTVVATDDLSNSSCSGDNTSSFANIISPSNHAYVPDSDYDENMTTIEDPMSVRIADLMLQIDSSRYETKKLGASPLRCQIDLNDDKYSASSNERNNTNPETNSLLKSISSRRVPRKCLDVARDGITNNRDSFTVSQLCGTVSPVSRKEKSNNTEGQASLAGFESALDFVSQSSSEKNKLCLVPSPVGLPKVSVTDRLRDNLIELDESTDESSTSSEDSSDENDSSLAENEIPSSSSTPFIRQSAARVDTTDSYSESMAESDLDDITSNSKRHKTTGGNTSSGFGSGAFESAVEILGHESIAKYDLYEVLSPLKTKNKSSKFLQVKDQFPSISYRSPVRNESYARAKVSIPWSAIDEAPSGSSSSSGNDSTSDEESTCAPLSRQWLVNIDETENSESMAASELDDTRTVSNRRRSIIGNTSSGLGSGEFESAVDFLGHESIAAYNLYEVLCPVQASKKSTKVSQSLPKKFEKLDCSSTSTHTFDFHSPRQGRKNSLSNCIKRSSIGNPVYNSNQFKDSSVTCNESFLRRSSTSHQMKDNSQEMNNSKLIIHDTFPIPPQRDLEEIEDIQPPRFSLFVPLSNFLSNVGSGLVSMRSSLARDSSTSGMESIQKQPKDFRMKDLQRLKILGEGQFGQVWLVSDSQKNAYALKMFAKYDLVQEGEAKMILEEAKMHQLVHNHPFIVKLISVFQDDSLLYLLQQFAQGGELFSVIERYSEAHETELEGSIVGMPEYQAKFYTVCIADALRHMHSMDIAYRDLKPENCMIDKDGYPLLIDMGYAKHVPDKTFTFCGTPRFLPPEAINPDSTGYDWTADHWSLGILVYEMLSGGVNPFSYDGISEKELFTAVENGKYPSIDISPAATDLISGLLTVDPKKRLGTKQGIGTQAILDHAWLFDMHLPDLRLRSIVAPWKPSTKSALDTSCFDDWSDIEDRGNQKYPKLTKKEEALFESIEY